MFDDVVVVYKFLGDLMFYVTGDQDENEVGRGGRAPLGRGPGPREVDRVRQPGLMLSCKALYGQRWG